MHDRLIGAAVGAGVTVVASLVDMNFAAVTGGMTLFGTAAIAIYYSFNQTRIKILRENADLRIENQKKEDEANKESLSAKVKKLEEDLAGSRQRRHQDANKFNAILMELQVKADLAEKKANEAAIRAARLEGHLVAIDKTHADGINANTKNIDAMAERSGIKLPEHPPPVEPIVPPSPNHQPEPLDPSDDDITPFFAR